MGTCYSCDNPPCEAPTTSTSTCTARPINCYIKEVAGGYEYGCGCPENAVCCADNSKCNLVSIIPGKSYNSGASYGLTVGLTVTLGVFLVVLFAFLIGFGLWLLIRRFLINTPLAQKGFFSKRILRNPLQHPLQQQRF